MSWVFLWAVTDNGQRHARVEQLVESSHASPAERAAIVKASARQRWDRLDQLDTIVEHEHVVPVSVLRKRSRIG